MSDDTRRKLTKIKLKLTERIGTPQEKWGDKRKLRKINRHLS